MSAPEDLTGARWSSAVRCVARATYQGLGIPGDEAALAPMRKHFARGANAAKAWIATQQMELAAVGRVGIPEMPIGWGLDWEGHADLARPEEKLIVEAYHSAGGAVLHVKALQAAGYADLQGDDWRAMLAVIDTTDCDMDDGFAVYTYPVDVNELRDEVRDIRQRVITAVQSGAVRDEDKVGDDPNHEECRTCPFREQCWADWVKPDIEQLEGLDDIGLRMLHAHLEVADLKKQLALAEERRQDMREVVAPYLTPGVEAIVGPVIVKRAQTRPRRNFKIAPYLDAGHPLTEVMAGFYDAKPSERWTVTAL